VTCFWQGCQSREPGEDPLRGCRLYIIYKSSGVSLPGKKKEDKATLHIPPKAGILLFKGSESKTNKAQSLVDKSSGQKMHVMPTPDRTSGRREGNNLGHSLGKGKRSFSYNKAPGRHALECRSYKGEKLGCRKTKGREPTESIQAKKSDEVPGPWTQ